MIEEIIIQNYKSIQKLKLELGRVTVLIGQNGCGKSNILEAIALASAAANDKLDNEFLAARGIRVTEPRFMRSAFEKENLAKDISIELRSNNEQQFSCILHNNNFPYSQWATKNFLSNTETSIAILNHYQDYSRWLGYGILTVRQAGTGALPLHILRGNKAAVWSFSPDGKGIASASADGTVMLWNFNFDDLLVQGCNYFQTNTIANSSNHHLCDGIGTQSAQTPKTTG